MSGEVWLLLRMLLSLVVVLSLAVVALRFLLPRLLRGRKARTSQIRVVEVAALDRQHKLALVQAREQEFLVVFGDGGVEPLGSWPQPTDPRELPQKVRSLKERVEVSGS